MNRYRGMLLTCRLALALLLGAAPLAVHADGRPGRDPGTPPVLVETVVDGRTLLLSSGVELRLATIVVDGATDSRSVLATLIADNPITYMGLGNGTDRHGRILAHALSRNGTWLQEALVEGGHARVYPALGETRFASALYRAERRARSRRTGLWADRSARIRNPSEAWNDRDSFQIVEGRVVATAIIRGTGYINFAEDWRRDFTLSLDKAALRRFERADLRLSSLEGRRVRARGWVRLRNGPMIDLTHPAQIEILGED